MDEFRKCRLCGEYVWADSHDCDGFRVTSNDGLCPRTVRATSFEDAAKKYAVDIDADGDYPIVSSGESYEVVVTKDGESRTFEVCGETVPEYHAWRID